jgi:hypothetical protein
MSVVAYLLESPNSCVKLTAVTRCAGRFAPRLLAATAAYAHVGQHHGDGE